MKRVRAALLVSWLVNVCIVGQILWKDGGIALEMSRLTTPEAVTTLALIFVLVMICSWPWIFGLLLSGEKTKLNLVIYSIASVLLTWFFLSEQPSVDMVVWIILMSVIGNWILYVACHFVNYLLHIIKRD
ncbi:MAG: hypothetical protein CL811_12925 [Colwelliaceae bacterium]|nr:hypothetical protein [Colwelliaceae bacterium]